MVQTWKDAIKLDIATVPAVFVHLPSQCTCRLASDITRLVRVLKYMHTIGRWIDLSELSELIQVVEDSVSDLDVHRASLRV